MPEFSTIVLTRPSPQSKTFASKLGTLGYRTLVFPSISIEQNHVMGKEAEYIVAISEGAYNWIAFVSHNAAEHLGAALRERLGHVTIPTMTRIAAQGKKSADAVQEIFGRAPDLVPGEFTAEALSKELIGVGIRGSRIALPIGSKARGVISTNLREAGAQIDEIVVYNNVSPTATGPEIEAILALDPAKTLVTFFSPSAIEGFWARLKGHEDFVRKLSFASVGPTTTQSLKAYGVAALVEADPHSEEGMLAAIEKLSRDSAR